MPITWGGGSWGFGSWGGTDASDIPDTLPTRPSRGNFASFALDSNGDLATPVAIARGPLAYAFRINSRLRFYAGEYFLDKRLGVPYYQTIFVKGVSLAVMNAVLTKVIATTPGVVSVDSFSSSLDKVKRIATADWTATINDGDGAGGWLTSRDEPFIVQGDTFGRSY